MKTNVKRSLPGRSNRTSRATLAVLVIIGLCLGLTRTAQADTLLFEGFEGSFPADNGWAVGDANATGTPAYWDDVFTSFGTGGTHGGNWKGYCAAVGYTGTSSGPQYQDYMDAYMRRTVDLRDYCNPSLSFWYRTPGIETCCDRLVVTVGDDLRGHTVVFSNASPTVAWVNVVVDLSDWIDSQPTLEFTFHSDYSGRSEGVYLDDIQVTATPALATIYSVWWGTQQDADGDGCLTAPNDTFRLNWDTRTCWAGPMLWVFEEIWRRPSGAGPYTLYYTTPAHIINGGFPDPQYLDIPASSGCAGYDYKIEAYRFGQASPDAVSDLVSNPILGNHKEELLIQETATLFSAQWSYQQDSDGDGCWAGTSSNVFVLAYDPDVVGCGGSLTVFEKVYSQTCGAAAWNLLQTTANHVISGCPVDLNNVYIPTAGGCVCKNYMIEIYRAGQAVPDYALSPTNLPSVLANHNEELYLQDECSLATATIADAWWSYQVDTDGDNCWEATAPSGFHLNWNPDVSVGGTCTLSVFEKVYLRLCGSPTWSPWTTTAPHTITGLSAGDQQFIIMPAGSACSCYDYKIEVYRAGRALPDYTRDPTNDPDLANHLEEALRPSPTLTITPAGSDVVLSWPSTYIGFTLQSASALPPGGWTPVVPAPVIVGSQWNVTNAIGDQIFYRLVNP